jgi:hypothetical protein
VDQEVVVPLVVRNLPLFPVWLGRTSATSPAKVDVPLPPLATATIPVTLAALPEMLPEMALPGMVEEAVIGLVPVPTR